MIRLINATIQFIMLELIKQPWHWSLAGVLIGLTVPTLLLLGNKHFGISANLRHICAACIPANIPFFKYEWKKEIWNFFFVMGILASLGAVLTLPGDLATVRCGGCDVDSEAALGQRA